MVQICALVITCFFSYPSIGLRILPFTRCVLAHLNRVLVGIEPRFNLQNQGRKGLLSITLIGDDNLRNQKINLNQGKTFIFSVLLKSTHYLSFVLTHQ